MDQTLSRTCTLRIGQLCHGLGMRLRYGSKTLIPTVTHALLVATRDDPRQEAHTVIKRMLRSFRLLGPLDIVPCERRESCNKVAQVRKRVAIVCCSIVVSRLTLFEYPSRCCQRIVVGYIHLFDALAPGRYLQASVVGRTSPRAPRTHVACVQSSPQLIC